MDIAESQDYVTINYIGRFKENNEIFDSSDESGPFEFEIGSDNVIDAINSAIIGMKVGDKKTIDVTPQDGYGEYQQELILDIPTEKLPEDSEVGDVLDEAVTKMQWSIVEIGETKSVINGNHPLAGKDLIFELELVELEKKSKGDEEE
jgi:peptidylprolyl isomerase